MAQNITNNPAFKKKLEQMTPQVPPLSGEVQFPTLDAIAQRTAAQVTPPPAMIGGQQSRAEEFGGTAMDVAGTIGGNILTGAKQGITNLIQGPAVAADVLFNPQRPSVSEAMSQRGVGVPEFGGGVAPQTSDAGIFTPAGTQTFGEITTAPKLGQTAAGDIGVQPQVPNAQPAGGLPMINGIDPNGVTFPTLGVPSTGSITKGGETFTTQGFGEQISVTTGMQPPTQGDPRQVSEMQQREAQIAQRVAGLTPEERAREIAMNDAAVNRAQIRGEEARGLFRPSEYQIQQAQQEAVARQADYEQRQVNNRIDSQMRQWERDNPRATEEATAMQRQQLIEQEGLVQKPEGTQAGGLTFDQQLALSKEQRAGRQEARDVQEAATEAQAAKQEMETKESDLYNLHQDSFDRQERYIEQALKNTGLLSTGFASISKFAPGTPARQLEESLKPILGEAAFGRLQQMRDASKTGGALGQVSERELGLLESAMGALSTSQNESQFRSNLLAYRKQLRESHARIQEAYKSKNAGGSGGRSAPRYKDDVNTSQSLDDILLPTSK